jgi:transcriptional regulator with XRE-family HTH domain
VTGDQLRTALAELKMTQAALAKMTGVHIQTMSKYCRGAMQIPHYVETIVTLLRERERCTAPMRNGK